MRRKIVEPDVLNILDRIIDSTNASYINHQIDKLKKERKHKFPSDLEVNKIPNYKKGKGLPIGYRNYNIMQTVIMKLCFLFYK